MVAVASLYDLLQVGVNALQGLNAILPGLGVFLVYAFGIPLTILAWLTFYVWFKLHWVSFMQPKRFAIMGLAGLADTIVSALPAWIAAVVLLVLTTRAEELLEKIPGGSKVAGVINAAGGKPGAALGGKGVGTPPRIPQTQGGAKPPPLPQSAGAPRRISDVRPNAGANRNAPTSRPSATPPPLPKQQSQYIKDWEEATKRFNDMETRQLIEKSYKGGMEKYKQDEAKQTADWERAEAAGKKFRESTKRYDALFNQQNTPSPMPTPKTPPQQNRQPQK